MDCMALATNTHTHCIRRHPHLATVEPSPAVTWAIAFISFLPHPSLALPFFSSGKSNSISF
jgi:hypothetical protein